MPGGGDECIRNSLVCKIVSVNSKYHGAVTCDVTPAFSVAFCFAECTRRVVPGVSKPCSGQSGLCLRGLGQSMVWGHGENGSLDPCPGIPKDALPCHMKTTPDDPAPLPGATEEIVLGEGVGLARSFLLGKQRVACLQLTGQPVGPAARNSCSVQARPCF